MTNETHSHAIERAAVLMATAEMLEKLYVCIAPLESKKPLVTAEVSPLLNSQGVTGLRIHLPPAGRSFLGSSVVAEEEITRHLQASLAPLIERYTSEARRLLNHTGLTGLHESVIRSVDNLGLLNSAIPKDRKYAVHPSPGGVNVRPAGQVDGFGVDLDLPNTESPAS